MSSPLTVREFERQVVFHVLPHDDAHAALARRTLYHEAQTNANDYKRRFKASLPALRRAIRACRALASQRHAMERQYLMREGPAFVDVIMRVAQREHETLFARPQPTAVHRTKTSMMTTPSPLLLRPLDWEAEAMALGDARHGYELRSREA